MKKKILFFSHNTRLTGAGLSLALLIENLDKDCFESVVVSPKAGPLTKRLGERGIKCYTVPNHRWVFCNVYKREVLFKRLLMYLYAAVHEIVAMPFILNIVNKERPDILYTNTSLIFSGAIAARLTKKPHVWHLRELLIDNPHMHCVLKNETIIKRIYQHSHTIITNSDFIAGQFSDFPDKKKVVVVYNAVEWGEYQTSQTLFSEFEELDKKDWLVSVIGYFSELKAQDVAIRAIHHARKYIPNIKLLLIGENKGRYYNYLTRLIDELSMGGNTVFTGQRPDVPAILSHCRVHLVPSSLEGFGRTALEAMLVSVPVIGVNAGGVKEVIQDGHTGFLVPEKDPEAMAEKIRLIYDNPQLGRELGDNGKKYAQENFSISKYVHSIERVLETVGN